MPKQKCNHCDCAVFNTQEEAVAHEAQCGCNEATKMCNTCQFYEEMGYPIRGSVLQCRNKQSPLYDQTVSVFMEDKNVEDFFPCPYWVKEVW